MKVQTNYNPDVLSCLANLSNDEVFTLPGLANQMLDLLPSDLWLNKEAKFLDPVSKSGVFLREIAQRLIAGLEKEIPDQQERINHICQNQIFGIAITELTSLLSRRSVYCSKTAKGKYSVCENFKNEQGNILFSHIEHTWEDGRCRYCNANQSEYDRGDLLETHAYQFLHTEEPSKIFSNMKFDVIVGNPPYQLSTGGAQSQATPLYDKFVLQAKKLNPRYLTMVIPSRWFSGGMGLDDFRGEMLNDSRIRKLVDYPISSECFPGVSIKGGICYFLWDRDNKGLCEIETRRGNQKSTSTRLLLNEGQDIFIRFNEALPILEKVSKLKEEPFANKVSSQKPFGFPTNFRGRTKSFNGAVKIYVTKDVNYINRKEVSINSDWIDKYKVLVTKGYGAGEDFPHQIINKPILAEPGSCCSETYIVLGAFSNRKEAENEMSYVRTRFFRFFVMLQKNTQDALRRVYKFVPMQDFSETWTDEKLYKKYGINKEEVAFIESMIRPME